MDSKDLSGVKHVRLDMTARDKGKGGPDKGHTTSFSPSKIVHYFPNFRSYFGMEYEQPWNMGKILLDIYIYIYVFFLSYLFIYVIFHTAADNMSLFEGVKEFHGKT